MKGEWMGIKIGQDLFKPVQSYSKLFRPIQTILGFSGLAGRQGPEIAGRESEVRTAIRENPDISC
jgi:hypothetical protein